MGARRRLATLAVLLAAGVTACSSCKRKDDPPPAEKKPPDRLAPSEVVEGKERAFGLPLPRVSRVAARFEKTVHVQTPLTQEELLQFVRARVKDGKVTPSAAGTQLFEVTPLGAPGRRLTIDVRPFRSGDGTRSEMVVRDATPAPIEPGLTDEQRWQKAGLTPDGRIKDPSHLQ